MASSFISQMASSYISCLISLSKGAYGSTGSDGTTKHDNPVLSHYLTTNGLNCWCLYLELELSINGKNLRVK